jgi:hypothetical protein
MWQRRARQPRTRSRARQWYADSSRTRLDQPDAQPAALMQFFFTTFTNCSTVKNLHQCPSTALRTEPWPVGVRTSLRESLHHTQEDVATHELACMRRLLACMMAIWPWYAVTVTQCVLADSLRSHIATCESTRIIITQAMRWHNMTPGKRRRRDRRNLAWH